MNAYKLAFLNFAYRISRPNHWLKIKRHSRKLDLFILDVINNNVGLVRDYNEFSRSPLTAFCIDRKSNVLLEIWMGSYPFSYGGLYDLQVDGFRQHPLSIDPDYNFHHSRVGSYVAVQLKKYLDEMPCWRSPNQVENLSTKSQLIDFFDQTGDLSIINNL